MELTHWGVIPVDEERSRRLATGYAIGAGVFLIMGLLAARFGDRPAEVVAEPEVEVKMVARQEEAAPEPPPPPPPPVVKAAPSPAPIALGAPEATIPTEMPKELPTARAPVQALEGVGDPNGVVGGAPLGEKKVEAPAPVVEAPPAPAVVAEHGPTQLSEEDTPPELLEKPDAPKFPEEARAQGIEATIVIKFVVDEKGAVRDVRVLKGHPLFNDLAVEWVKQWKYAPARDPEGHVKAVFRTTKIPFSLRG